jgi:hypothetical protein
VVRGQNRLVTDTDLHETVSAPYPGFKIIDGQKIQTDLVTDPGDNIAHSLYSLTCLPADSDGNIDTHRVPLFLWIKSGGIIFFPNHGTFFVQASFSNAA